MHCAILLICCWQQNKSQKGLFDSSYNKSFAKWCFKKLSKMWNNYGKYRSYWSFEPIVIALIKIHKLGLVEYCAWMYNTILEELFLTLLLSDNSLFLIKSNSGLRYLEKKIMFQFVKSQKQFFFYFVVS